MGIQGLEFDRGGLVDVLVDGCEQVWLGSESGKFRLKYGS